LPNVAKNLARAQCGVSAHVASKVALVRYVMRGSGASCALPDVPVAWMVAALSLSVCAGVVFLADMLRAVPLPPGWAGRGKEGGPGETSGERPWACGEGCPRGVPPARK
jgi:hypothetical protein